MKWMMKFKLLTTLFLLKANLLCSCFLDIEADPSRSYSRRLFCHRDLHPKEVRLIGTEEFSVAAADDEKHVVATYYSDIGRGIVVAIYNPDSKKASLAWLDESCRSEIKAPLSEVCGSDYSKAKIQLLSHSSGRTYLMERALKDLGVRDTAFGFKELHHQPGELYSRSIGIDAKWGGEIFTYDFDPHESKYYNRVFEKRIEQIKRKEDIWREDCLFGYNYGRDCGVTLDFIKD